MAWQDVLADLEAQAEAESDAAMEAEVADRSRRERAEVHLVDRLAAAIGTAVVIDVGTPTPISGRLIDAGIDWLLVGDPAAPARELVVPLVAVEAVRSAHAWSAPAELSTTRRALDLAWLLRRVARDRSTVRIRTIAGATYSGTIDRVGSDHLDLAVHDTDVARRSAEVRERAVVVLSAIATLERV